MTRQQLAFLAGGFLFGILFGFGLFHGIASRPLQPVAAASAEPAEPQGPRAPTDARSSAGSSAPTGGAPTGAAPMIAEINRLKQQVTANPNDVESLLRLGAIYWQVGMRKESAVFYERVVEQRPDDVGSLLRLGEIYEEQSMWPQAVRVYQGAVERHPRDAGLITQLGIAYRGGGEPGRALEEFQRAYELDPTHWKSLFNTVVVAAFDLGRHDLALEALRVLESIAPRPADLDPAQLQQLRQAVEEEMRGPSGQPATAAS